MIGKLATTGAARPAVDDKRQQLAKAAQAFEAVFVRQMIGSMRQASLGEDLFGSSATDQFRDMQDSRLADQMAADGGFGIARMLMQQFDRANGK